MTKTRQAPAVVLDNNDAEFLAALLTDYMAKSFKSEHLMNLRDKLWGIEK